MSQDATPRAPSNTLLLITHPLVQLLPVPMLGTRVRATLPMHPLFIISASLLLLCPSLLSPKGHPPGALWGRALQDPSARPARGFSGASAPGRSSLTAHLPFFQMQIWGFSVSHQSLTAPAENRALHCAPRNQSALCRHSIIHPAIHFDYITNTITIKLL